MRAPPDRHTATATEAAAADLSEHPVYQAALRDAARALMLHQPGEPGAVLAVDLQDPQPAPNRQQVAMVGAVAAALEGTPSQRVCLLDLASGQLELPLPQGGSQRCPRWSACGRWLALVTRPTGSGRRARAVVLDRHRPEAAPRLSPECPGSVESLQWVGTQALILVLTDTPVCDGEAFADANAPDQQPVGLPAGTGVGAGSSPPHNGWRRVAWWDLASNRIGWLSPVGLSVWEAAWCSGFGLVLLVSDTAAEDAWYSARLEGYAVAMPAAGSLPGRPRKDEPRWTLATPHGAERYAILRVAPDGRHVAYVQGVCSDRALPSGRPWLLDTATGQPTLLHDLGTDVTHLAWDGDEMLLFAGLRGLETGVTRATRHPGLPQLLWADTSRTVGPPRGPECAPWVAGGALAFVEGFVEPPHLAALGPASERRLWTPTLAPLHDLPVKIRTRRWASPDGLNIEGWLMQPQGASPHPLVVDVHGGPVWAHRPFWLGRAAALPRVTLLRAGFALLLPNPRGSSGRGQRFAQAVVGDMGGAETRDLLAGIDTLVTEGFTDANRIAVMGVSHGGFIAAWLAVSTNRFAAAVAVSPVTDWRAEITHGPIPSFCRQFLGRDAASAEAAATERSPLLSIRAGGRTAVLTVSGAHDPGTQAETWHRALLRVDTPSLWLHYPHDGHGVRTLPAAVDHATRLVLWLQQHLSPDRP